MNNKKQIIAAGVVLVFGVLMYISYMPTPEPEITELTTVENEATTTSITENNLMKSTILPTVTPIEHASFFLNWSDVVVYFDPVGSVEAYGNYPAPNLILVTDIHSDHLDIQLLTDLVKENVTLIAPQAVIDELPEALKVRTTLLTNGEKTTYQDIQIEAVPMYNLPGESEKFHAKGRGNGYVLEQGGVRVYNAGDTAGTAEMKALENIDIAFVPMNLPYTMDITEAASAVLAFTPKQVYPFHYRGPDGLSDVASFKVEVESKNPDITVVLANWYLQN